MTTRLLLNGKKAAQQDIRDAVMALRKEGHTLEVRPTWEAGDIERLVCEAAEQQVTRVIAGGGDGTVNEVVDAILKHQLALEVAVLPLGTANDFARACHVPTDSPYQALKLALSGESYRVDAAKANERHFINIATAGFGAQVTANTPVALKNFLGGGAYTLSGLLQAINFQPFEGTIRFDDNTREAGVVVGAVCNGRLAGGGQALAPNAYIDDGLLEAVSIEAFSAADIPVVLSELQQQGDGETQFIHRKQVKRIEWLSNQVMPINLDGEPLSCPEVVMEVLPQALALVLPESTPVLSRHQKA